MRLQSTTALDRIYEIAWGHVGRHALRTGHELGAFEALRDGPLTLQVVAERTKLKPVAARHLLMALATLPVRNAEDLKKAFAKFES